MNPWRASIAAVMLSACGVSVSPEAGVDTNDGGVVETDIVGNSDVVDDALRDVVARDASDAGVVPDARSCAPPSEPRPARTLRSCSGPNGAPIEHCREVWVCPARPTRIGSTDAWVRQILEPMERRQGPLCDMGLIDVHPSYIDAYEVSVARFRAWVRAGTPQPRPGTQLWMMPSAGATWRGVDRFEEPTFSCAGTSSLDPMCTRPDPAQCSYRATPGENDNLPVNCVDPLSMMAFCWWEGKRLPTEALWEHVARNGGRTALPFSERVRPGPFDPCLYGDVAGCPRTMQLPHAIDAHPLGQSVDPAGVFGLWGGVYELTWMLARLMPTGCLGNFGPDMPFPERGSQWLSYSFRGRDYVDTTVWASRFDHAATRMEDYRGIRDPGAGFRCSRWVPEPYAPEE
jgi:formylglycine-generating enzyme required for sulfatase activity